MMKKSINKLMSKIGFVLGLSGIIFFALGLFCTDSLFDRIMLLVCSLLLFSVGGLYIFIESNGKPKTKANLFLYNPITKRERRLKELKFSDICTTLDLFIPIYAYSNAGDAWFDRNVALRYKNYNNNTLVKLIYYRLLYIWIDGASDNEYERFGDLSKSDVDYIVDFMMDMGEYEISSKIKNLDQIYNGNVHELRSFFVDKKEYLEKIMLDMVKDNIDDF